MSRYLEAIQTCTLLLSSLFDEAERGDSFTTRARTCATRMREGAVLSASQSRSLVKV